MHTSRINDLVGCFREANGIPVGYRVLWPRGVAYDKTIMKNGRTFSDNVAMASYVIEECQRMDGHGLLYLVSNLPERPNLQQWVQSIS